MSIQDSIKARIDDAFRAAGDLVVTFGYIDRGAKSYDVATGSKTSDDEDGEFKGIITDWEDTREGLIRAGDKKILVKADGLEFTPSPDDQVTLNGQTWTIINPFPTYAGEIPVLYELQVRP